MANTQPNILFIFTDQLRADCIGSYPDSQVLTPSLDRIADEGVTFLRCASNSPLCVPARAALMTGLLPRQTGVWSNRLGADENGQSHVRNIRDVGYETAVIGKTHLWRDGPAGKPGRHVREMSHRLTAWGFNHSHELNDPIGTSTQGCCYTDYLASKGWLEGHRRYMKSWIAEMRSGNATPWAQEPAPVPPFEDIDSYVGRRVVEWLQRYSGSKPFYLQAQFTGPHDPYDGPYEFRDLYDPYDLEVGIADSHESPTQAIDARRRRLAAVTNATRYQLQRWRVAYFANITLIDYWIGRIVETLKNVGAWSNTWIVFNSDHGEQLGEHGLSGKAVFYDQSVFVPCVIRAPSPIAGRKSNALIEQVDIPNTLVDIAQAEPLANSMGTSLIPYLQCDRNDSRLNEGKEFVASELFGETTIVTERYKLTARVEDGTESQLFDRESDPHELVNQVANSSYNPARKQLTTEELDSLKPLTNHAMLANYRAYVRETGSLN